MANIFQQLAQELGLSNQAAEASADAAPPNSSNVALALTLSNQLLSGSEHLYLAGPGDATITVANDQHNVIVGSSGADHLSGGKGPDVIIGGADTNVMTGNGGADIFAHVAGATDFITDFSPAAGEKIALAAGLSMTASHATTVDPTTIGMPAGAGLPAVQMNFSDGSTITLVNSTAHPEAAWFL
ncbi:MAG TPA: hypothetical protein HPQ04_00810 [Rhodospirillaceae bacterium]|nr:hypothetical protein [Rhodospirillaceae bacterium]